MKTKYKYIEFLKTPKEWLCVNRRGGYSLGAIALTIDFGRRQWNFAPQTDTVFSSDCLADIAQFLNDLNCLLKSDKPKLKQ